MTGVNAYGAGLVGGRAGDEARFTVFVGRQPDRHFTPALRVEAAGPAQPTIAIRDKKDGTFEVAWRPTAAGLYDLSVLWDGRHVRGSPFAARVTGGREPSRSHRATASGRGSATLLARARPAAYAAAELDARADAAATLHDRLQLQVSPSFN